MYSIKRWILQRLNQKAIPYLKAFSLLKANKYIPALLWEPEGGTIVVLAPHMDDEIFGCGGTLYKHACRGAEVTAVYLTTGMAGGKMPEHDTGGKADLAAVRKQEARQAMQAIGIQAGIFLDVPDGHLEPNSKIQNELRNILNSIRPTLVYLPFFLEEHPDHRAAVDILFSASAVSNWQFDCCFYEIWTPLFPNCIVDISNVIDIKKKAIECYHSQLAVNNYQHAFVGLNAYRALALASTTSGFAEAFWRLPLTSCRKLYATFCEAR
jgi:N-acetylglucosamine malate deacetylase 1